MPEGWTGRFWARTECDFSMMVPEDQNFTTCSSNADCTNAGYSGDICFGGSCVADCSSGDVDCTSVLGNPNAVCETEGGQQFCGFASGTVCQTGDCGFGLYQCQGTWNGTDFGITGDAPTSLFEATISTTSLATVNYDVSLVSGYNTPISASPSASGCYAPACTSDLNATCPTNLQVTEAPTAIGTIPCGTNTFCESGACVSGECVVGCNDPGDQCSATSPPTALDCNTAVPSGDNSTYFDMYTAANKSGKGTNAGSDIGAAMSSGNQGTPTCWGNADCLPSETCEMGVISGFPAGLGICASSTSPTFQPQINCSGASDVGNACGGYEGAGYPNAQGDVCEAATLTGPLNGTYYVCVPPYNPAINGMGSPQTPTGGGTTLFTGPACPANPEWLTAATNAGGGTTPWYETFSNACPHQYGWQYDDHAGDIGCTPGGTTPTDMTVTFGLSQ